MQVLGACINIFLDPVFIFGVETRGESVEDIGNVE